MFPSRLRVETSCKRFPRLLYLFLYALMVSFSDK